MKVSGSLINQKHCMCVVLKESGTMQGKERLVFPTAQVRENAMFQSCYHTFLPGGRWTICPKNSYKFPNFFFYENDALTMAYICSKNVLTYEYIMWAQKTLWNLNELAVSSISTAKDINDTIQVIVDFRVGICPFNVNKCNVADTLLLYGAAEVSFQSTH